MLKIYFPTTSARKVMFFIHNFQLYRSSFPNNIFYETLLFSGVQRKKPKLQRKLANKKLLKVDPKVYFINKAKKCVLYKTWSKTKPDILFFDKKCTKSEFCRKFFTVLR